jgi:hypothetical protein
MLKSKVYYSEYLASAMRDKLHELGHFVTFMRFYDGSYLLEWHDDSNEGGSL